MSNAAVLKGLLYRSYRSGHSDRAGDTNIHATHLINFCPRAYYLCKEHDQSLYQHRHPGMHMGWTFDIGHALQDIQVKRLMSQGVVFGSWQCRHCGHLEVGVQENRRPCPKCKCKAWKYRDLGVELALPVKTDPPSQLVVRGNVDYVVATAPDVGFIVDAKSIKAEDFDKLTDVHVDYKRQLRLYMWLLNHKRSRLVGEPRDPGALAKFKFDGSTAVCAYCVKGARKEPFKLFDVKQDRPFIKEVDGRLQALVKHLEEETAPPRICQSQASMLARNCSARTLCFTGEGL